MKRIPVKNLYRLNWMLALVVAMLLGMVLSTYLDLAGEIIYGIVNGLVSILLMSYLHVWVRLQLKKRYPRISFKQYQFWLYVITYFVILSYSLLISPVKAMFADERWHSPTFEQRLITVIAGSFFLNTIIFIIHNSAITYQAKVNAEVENERLKLANSEANNLLLKQQIHPHFLFNSLSIIKTLYRTNIGDGDTYIVHLADFLRASLSNSSAKLVKLTEEIKLCDDYIGMQKIRFGDALRYQCNIDDDVKENGYVPSFSLQPLLENAIKHNEATGQNPLFIKVSDKDGFVLVENNLQKRSKPVVSTGNGLLNLMKRYKLISGDDVVIKETDNDFCVCLKILNA